MNKHNLLKTCSAGVLATLAFQANAKNDSRPNVLLIMVDDLGYSDLGCYGGEVQTPNLDKLASQGLRFSNFYNAGRSCPTRASLMTGLYQHQAGIGRMTFNDNLPGYKGTLTHQAVTIAEVMKGAGYRTGMVGKWHVAETPLRTDQRDGLNHQVFYENFAPLDNYPMNRGFENYHGIIYGVADYFDPFSLVDGVEPVNAVPKDYYITNALTDTAVTYVNNYAKGTAPFFIYLAYTAPHWPLHALPEDIAKYEDTYKVGWDSIRNRRYERMKELGIFPKSSDFLSTRQFNDKWENNADQDWDAKAMAVHAAMVDRVDQGIGKVLEALKRNGQLENTLILFMSDNGCSNEVCENYSPGENDRPDMTRDGRPIIYPRKKEALPGPETTFASVGPKWANVSNTPFRFWKAKMYEGGICTPMIAYWPKGIKKNLGGVTSQMGHVMDVMATCVELGKADYPTEYNGNKIIPMEGVSLRPIFQKGKREGHDYLGFEHFREKALIGADGWKIVTPSGDGKWELYHIAVDRSEKVNLADQNPEKVREMVQKYDEWAKRCQVVPAP